MARTFKAEPIVTTDRVALGYQDEKKEWTYTAVYEIWGRDSDELTPQLAQRCEAYEQQIEALERQVADLQVSCSEFNLELLGKIEEFVRYAEPFVAAWPVWKQGVLDRLTLSQSTAVSVINEKEGEGNGICVVPAESADCP